MLPEKIDLRVVFMGSPDFALPSLRALQQHSNVIGVVTQPDRPAGRGRKLQPPPIKTLAESFGIPAIQPSSLKSEKLIKQLNDWAPDIIIVAAYGQILRKNVLSLPKYGCLNVHASLLPRWRGAAPIQAAILAGDEESGVTIMQMDAGLDTGPIISQQAVSISATENAASLSEKLSESGAELLLASLPGYISGDLKPKAQNDDLSTYAGMLRKSDGELDFTNKADYLARKVRAYSPWPGTYAIIADQPLKIHQSSVLKGLADKAGMLAIKNGLPAISSIDAWLLLEELQATGKRPMSGEDFLRGNKDWEGFVNSHSSKEKT